QRRWPCVTRVLQFSIPHSAFEKGGIGVRNGYSGSTGIHRASLLRGGAMRAMRWAGAWAVAAILAAAAPAAAIEKDDIDKSVKRGVEALRRGEGNTGRPRAPPQR